MQGCQELLGGLEPKEEPGDHVSHSFMDPLSWGPCVYVYTGTFGFTSVGTDGGSYIHGDDNDINFHCL